jgi:hypothetical protein
MPSARSEIAARKITFHGGASGCTKRYRAVSKVITRSMSAMNSFVHPTSAALARSPKRGLARHGHSFIRQHE